jgi:hypothetical protein
MGLSVNVSAILVGLAAFAGGTRSRSAAPRFICRVNLLEGVGILTLLFSIVAPNDGFQQKLIRPPTPSLGVSTHIRVAPRRSPLNLWTDAFVTAQDPVRVLKTSLLFVKYQPLELDTHFYAPIAIHSPPITS